MFSSDRHNGVCHVWRCESASFERPLVDPVLANPLSRLSTSSGKHRVAMQRGVSSAHCGLWSPSGAPDSDAAAEVLCQVDPVEVAAEIGEA